MSLPLCTDPSCDMCAPWRSFDPAPPCLTDLIALAGRMRKTGWLPHERPTQWWRVETEGTPHCFVPPASVREKVDRAQREAARPARTPALVILTDEERLQGGVFVGAAGKPFAAYDLPAVNPNGWRSCTRADERPAIYGEIMSDLCSGALELGEVVAGGRVFAGPKGRLLYHPRAVNDAIPEADRTVKYGRMYDAFGPGATCAVKVDLKSAFKSVPVATQDRRYLGMSVDGVTLRYARLPFGLATSPRLFVDLLRRTLRQFVLPDGVAMVDYVDDVLLTGVRPDVVVATMCDIIEALRADGWRVACSKVYLQPAASVVFLGMLLDLPRRSLALTVEKQKKALGLLATIESARGQPRLDALEKLLGMTAWASPVLRGVGFFTPPLWKVLTSGLWDDDAADALQALRTLVTEATTPTPIDRPHRQAVVVTDAGETSWAVAVIGADDHVQLMDRGDLPPALLTASSTAREAAAAVEAARLLVNQGVDVRDVTMHLQTDSTSLAACLNKERTRSPEVARVLQQLVALMRGGMAVRASWSRRTDGRQPLVDAGTAPHRKWHPGQQMAAWIRRNYQNIDVHVGAGSSEVALAPAYTSVMPDDDRRRLIEGQPAKWSGWVGHEYSFDAHGKTVLAHPHWDRVGEALGKLRHAKLIHILARASRLPKDLFDGKTGFVGVTRIPIFARGWVGEASDGTTRTLTFPDMVMVSYSPSDAQARADQFFRDALNQALNPGPVVDISSFFPGRVRVDAKAVRQGERMRPPDHRQGEDPAPAAKRGAQGKDLGVRAILTAIADDSYLARESLDATLEACARRYEAEVQAARRRQGLGTAPIRSARLMLAVMDGKDLQGLDATAETWDALAVVYAGCRIEGAVPGSLRAVLPRTVAGELSALKAALVRYGINLPPYMGPRVTRHLAERGAFEKRDNAVALPLHLSWLLEREPDMVRDGLGHECWASRVLQSAFVLRAGVVSLLTKSNLVPWGPGFVLVWRARDKTRRGDIIADGESMKMFRISATAQPQAVEVIRRYWSRVRGAEGRVFPNVSKDRALRWLKATYVKPLGQGHRLSTHGFRVGANIELHELNAPEDFVNVMGWWRRGTATGRSMNQYYNSVDLGRLMMVASKMGRMRSESPAVGFHFSSVGHPGYDWDKEWRRFSPLLSGVPAPSMDAWVASARVITDAAESDSEND